MLKCQEEFGEHRLDIHTETIKLVSLLVWLLKYGTINKNNGIQEY